MKKIYPIHRILTAVLPSAMLMACDVHEFPGEPVAPDPETPKVNLAVIFADTEWPQHATVEYDPSSRTTRADSHAIRYILNVYEATNEVQPSRHPVASDTVTTTTPESLATAKQTIAVSLNPGNYSAIVWADYVAGDVNGNDLYYATADISSISIAGADHPGNTHYREAFRGQTYFTVMRDGTVLTDDLTNIEEIPVSMRRPMARYEFITTDLREFVSDQSRDGLDEYTVRFRYASYMPSTYNAVTDRPIDAKLNVSYGGRISRISDTEASLGFDHVFVGDSETSVQVAVDIHDAQSNELIASTSPITVPLLRNSHTTVRGKFLTTSTGGGVGIDPGFNGSFDIIIQ